MNRNAMIAVVVVVLIILGAGAYVLTTKSQKPGIQTINNITQETGTSTPNTLRGLLGLGTSQTCTYNDTESQSSGTIYVSGGKVRADFTADANEGVMVSHMMTDGTTSYVWSDGQTTGIKMTVSDNQPQGTPNQTNSQNVDVDKEINYDCKSWSADSSMFDLPSGIEFQDLSSMMQQNTITGSPAVSGTGSPTSQCSSCNSLPAGAKEQCLQALGC